MSRRRGVVLPLSEAQVKAMIWSADHNKDDVLSIQELTEGFKSLGSRLPILRGIEALLAADRNRDGRIDKKEGEALVKYAFAKGYTIN